MQKDVPSLESEFRFCMGCSRLTYFQVRIGEFNLAVNAPGTQQSLIQDVDAIRAHNDLSKSNIKEDYN